MKPAASYEPSQLDVSSSLPERITQASRRPSNLGQVVPGTVSLAMGEPNGDTAPQVVERAKASLDQGHTHYAAASGLPELKQALAEHTSGKTGRPTTEREVVLAHGASAALATITMALVQPGDRVVVPEPTYSLYADHIAMVGAQLVSIPPKDDGSLDFQEIATALQDARLLILCNPSNPTGAVLQAHEMQQLEKLLSDNPDTLLVSDEAYSDLIFDNEKFISALSLSSLCDRTIMVGTFSKSYAMTGWRLGYAIAPENIAQRIDLVHRTINGSLNTFVQDAGVAALSTPPEDLADMRDDYQRRRDLVVDELSKMKRVSVQKPAGAFYAFPHIETSLSSQEMVEEFARGGVLVRSGSEYGASGEGHVRISFAADDETLKQGLQRFGDVVSGLPY